MTLLNQVGGAESVKERIEFIDGFRGVAVIMVVLFHYYSRYAHSPIITYPFGDVWAHAPVAKYGLYGVNLFFAVSGFVIPLTLVRCRSAFEFAARRFARLWPTMLLCSVLTFVFLCLYPRYFPQRIANFLPSLTFVDGGIYEQIFPGYRFAWIDGAYWSLFVEVQFYLIAAVLFFCGRQHFFRSLLLFSLFSTLGYWGLRYSISGGAPAMFASIFLTGYMPWFLIGVGAYAWSKNMRSWAVALQCIAVFKLLVSATQANSCADLIVGISILASFFVCFRVGVVRDLMSNRWLSSVGVASYSLYLLHENIGVTLTSVVADKWQVGSYLSAVIPLLVCAMLIGVSRVIWRFWETPWNNKIVHWLVTQRQGTTRGGPALATVQQDS
jgi:peptidoglycan/LPS O-acetylase OafA/YrhL